MNTMDAIISKINAMLARTTPESGTTVHEAHTAAVLAGNLARKHGLGHLAARARVAEYKAEARVLRAS
jgi:hypothetical protein